MRVIAFNGSPKKNGNTASALEIVMKELENAGIETEMIQVGNKKIRGCIACGACMRNKDEKCIINDEVNEWMQKIKAADGLLLGSPVYYAGISGTMKSFLDRAFEISNANGNMVRHKIAAPVVAVRRSGGMPTMHQLNNYIIHSEMLMPTSNYWNVIHGTFPGDVKEDEEGIQIMRVLGKNMAWLMQLIENGSKEFLPPVKEEKILTHFIR